jgi:hypothetical protein
MPVEAGWVIKRCSSDPTSGSLRHTRTLQAGPSETRGRDKRVPPIFFLPHLLDGGASGHTIPLPLEDDLLLN